MGSRAVIVEDHDALSRGLELVLGKAGIDVIGSARTEQEGYEVIVRERPGLAVVDLGLAEGSGVELARRIAESQPDVGVLIYTGLDDQGLLREALDSGARGFALKAGPARDLVAAARAVAAGGSYVDPHLTFLLGEAAADVVVLSPREREVMALLAEGLKGPQVAERLR
ncbi:MAG TPA: response regulator transcription factor, partial [Thermoleophilaceae bacterium]|nr:response regulator transcription factor [Thermoleophilaceae bacterium]